MNWNRAINELESGAAEAALVALLIVKSGDRYFVSFDGMEWEETESNIIQKQL